MVRGLLLDLFILQDDTDASQPHPTVNVRRKKLVAMVMDGVSPSEVKDELNANAAKREALKARLAAADAPPPCCTRRWRGLYQAGLRIELKGNLAAMLGSNRTSEEVAKTGDLLLQLLVAGGGFEPPTFGL